MCGQQKGTGICQSWRRALALGDRRDSGQDHTSRMRQEPSGLHIIRNFFDLCEIAHLQTLRHGGQTAQSKERKSHQTRLPSAFLWLKPSIPQPLPQYQALPTLAATHGRFPSNPTAKKPSPKRARQHIIIMEPKIFQQKAKKATGTTVWSATPRCPPNSNNGKEQATRVPPQRILSRQQYIRMLGISQRTAIVHIYR